MQDLLQYKTALDSKLHNKYIEQLSLLMLKYICPDSYSNLSLADSPDLQSLDMSIGIEVTEAISQSIARIDGEFVKMRFGKKETDARLLCKKKIELNGGEVDDISLSYPPITSKEEIKIFQNAVQRKMPLLPTYRDKGFQKVGLFVFYDQPPIPFDFADSLEWFAEIQRKYHDNYDFLFFGYHCGIIQYDFKKMIFDTYRIGQSAFHNMCILARNEVEKK